MHTEPDIITSGYAVRHHGVSFFCIFFLLCEYCIYKDKQVDYSHVTQRIFDKSSHYPHLSASLTLQHWNPTTCGVS